MISYTCRYVCTDLISLMDISSSFNECLHYIKMSIQTRSYQWTPIILQYKCLHLKTVEVRVETLRMTDVQRVIKYILEMTIPITFGKVLFSRRQLKSLAGLLYQVFLLLFECLFTLCHPIMHCWMHQASDCMAL